MLDYEKEFQVFLNDWMKKSGVVDVSEIDDKVPDLYEEWLNTPSEAFLSIRPIDFFKPITDPIKLIDVLGKYIFSDIQVPGPLLNEIANHSDEIYPLLVVSIKNHKTNDIDMDDYISYCVELISEMDKAHPTDDYLRIIAQAQKSTDLIESMVEILRAEIANEDLNAKIKRVYDVTSHEFAKDCLLDLLSELVFDREVYDIVLDCFLVEPTKSWLYAHMLAKIGIGECTEYLIERLKEPYIDYFNYTQVKEALEELGGVCEIDRRFDDDTDFDRMSTIEQEDIQDTDDEEYDE